MTATATLTPIKAGLASTLDEGQLTPNLTAGEVTSLDRAEQFTTNAFANTPTQTASSAQALDSTDPAVFGAQVVATLDSAHILQDFQDGKITPDMLTGEKGKWLMMQIEQIQQNINQIFEAYSNLLKEQSDSRKAVIDNWR
jgi:hypothetical protein